MDKTIKSNNMRLLKLSIVIICLGLFSSPSQAQKKVLSLNDAINIAAKNSPDIQVSRLGMVRNQELLNAQIYGLKTRFNLEVSPFAYSRESKFVEVLTQWNTTQLMRSSGTFSVVQPIKATDGTVSLINSLSYQDFNNITDNTQQRGFDNNLYLQINQPLFTYNRTKLNLERLEFNLENATLAYKIQLLNLEKTVAQYFYAIYQRQMALQIAKEEYQNQKVSYDIIADKVEAGISAVEEKYQAELNLATSKSNLQNKKVDLENSQDQFKQLIGMSLFDSISLVTDIDYTKVQVNLQSAIENGLQNRLELRQREIDLENANFDLIESSATNEFRADLDLSVGLMGNDENFVNVYDKPTTSPQFEIKLAVPIYDWGQRKARIRAAEADLEATRIQQDQQETDITINIMQVYRSLLNLENQITIAEQNEVNAQLTYDINLERYRNGDLTSIDLERFQNQLSEKKMNKVNSLIDYKLELLNLKIQCLYDFETNTSFIPNNFESNEN
jgi:outer membrane protein TolC